MSLISDHDWMTEYFDISDPYADLEDELSRLIEVLQAPPRLETLTPAMVGTPALPPGRARKPGKGCGAAKERIAMPLANSVVSEGQFSSQLSGVGCDSSVGVLSMAELVFGDSVDSAIEDRSMAGGSAICGAPSRDKDGFAAGVIGMIADSAKLDAAKANTALVPPFQLPSFAAPSVGELAGRTERCASVAASSADEFVGRTERRAAASHLGSVQGEPLRTLSSVAPSCRAPAVAATSLLAGGTLTPERLAMSLAGSKMAEDQFSYLISGVGCDSSVGGVSLAVRAIGDSFDSAKEDRSLDNCAAVCGASSCDGVGLLSGINKFPEFSIHNQIHNPVSRVACNISVGTICSEFSGRTERCASVALSLDDQIAVFSDDATEMNLPKFEVAIPVGAEVAYQDVIGNREIVADVLLAEEVMPNVMGKLSQSESDALDAEYLALFAERAMLRRQAAHRAAFASTSKAGLQRRASQLTLKQLLATVRNVKRSSVEAMEAWNAYCDAELGGAREPGWLAATALQRYLDLVPAMLVDCDDEAGPSCGPSGRSSVRPPRTGAGRHQKRGRKPVMGSA